MSGEATGALWARYRESGDPAARAEILSELMGLVHHTARQIARRVGDAVAYDDLVGAGSLGLVQAFGGFDPHRGVSFVTYATTRIRGAVLDELRAADWRPRSVRTRARELEAAAGELYARLGRPPRHVEVAEELDIDPATYWKWRSDAETGAVVPLDDRSPGPDGDRVPLADRLADPAAEAPDFAVEATERADQVQAAIRDLSEQQRTVLALCYYEGLSLRQVAEVLHVTESRISQIRTAAIRNLRARLEDAA
ncbi:MAG: FliA/WhiG family RNA polymerase sigma factor [Gemmatimonadota bacterium]|nr:FliA/WhiG family RNA polymerase sigma factor [Gemmatimonadota bacterium]